LLYCTDMYGTYGWDWGCLSHVCRIPLCGRFFFAQRRKSALIEIFGEGSECGVIYIEEFWNRIACWGIQYLVIKGLSKRYSVGHLNQTRLNSRCEVVQIYLPYKISTNIDIQPRGNYNYELFATGGRDDTVSGEVVFQREDLWICLIQLEFAVYNDQPED